MTPTSRLARRSTAESPTATASPVAELESAPASSLVQPGRWDLSDLLPDTREATIGPLLAELESQVRAFEGWRERLRPDIDPAELLAALRLYEDIFERLDVLGGYASLWFSEEVQSAAALSYRDRIRQLSAAIDNRVLFFSLWWKGLDDADAARLLPVPPEEVAKEADFRHFLEELRRFKPYTLDERSEQLINVKNTHGIEAVRTIYSMLKSRLEMQLEIDGERKTLTEEETRAYFHSTRPELREAAVKEVFRVYERESAVLAQIYATRVRDWHSEYVELRGFPSAISVRNLSNDVPDRAVEVLLEVVEKNAPLFRRWFALKARWLGTERLRRYDLYAPLAGSERKVPYAEAVAEVLDVFTAFHPRVGELARRVFDRRHIDAEIRKGKRGGAFCATLLPRMTPWVMVTYTGKVRDVATLAHELGHAVHSLLAADHSLLTQHASLPLAETASVFGEMLVTERLLAGEKDPRARRDLLGAALDDIYATVMRQAYFVRFELAAHAAVMDNKSADELHALYFEHLRQQFGDAVEIPDELRYEWISIPHMLQTPFYCYAYSFGQLLVLALYRRYQQDGEAFKPGYLRLLAHGGAVRPEAALAELGIDAGDPRFWQGGFAVVESMLEELEALAAVL